MSSVLSTGGSPQEQGQLASRGCEASPNHWYVPNPLLHSVSACHLTFDIDVRELLGASDSV